MTTTSHLPTCHTPNEVTRIIDQPYTINRVYFRPRGPLHLIRFTSTKHHRSTTHGQVHRAPLYPHTQSITTQLRRRAEATMLLAPGLQTITPHLANPTSNLPLSTADSPISPIASSFPSKTNSWTSKPTFNATTKQSELYNEQHRLNPGVEPLTNPNGSTAKTIETCSSAARSFSPK